VSDWNNIVTTTGTSSLLESYQLRAYNTSTKHNTSVKQIHTNNAGGTLHHAKPRFSFGRGRTLSLPLPFLSSSSYLLPFTLSAFPSQWSNYVGPKGA